MSNKFTVCFILSGYILATEVAGSIPPFGVKFYLRSALDNGYLKPVGNYELCKQLSALTTVPVRENSEIMKWKFTGLPEYFHVEQDKSLGSNFQANSLAFYSPPPSCFRVFNDLILLENKDQYIIKSKAMGGDKCLRNHGSGGGVDWERCDFTQNFIWKFELA